MRTLGDKASFTPEERRVWSSHIKLALTIGRGQAAWKQKSSNHSFLHESDDRLEVFRHIATVEKERHQGTITADYFWPLFLPPVQHALVAATLSSSLRTSEDSTTSPELFLCDSFLKTLESYPAASTSDMVNALYDIPISMRDAR